MPRYSPFRRPQISRKYAGTYDAEAKTLLEGASGETVEYYYTARADGDGIWANPQSDMPTSGNVIVRKLWYKREATANPDGSGWAEYSPQPANDTSYADALETLLDGLKGDTAGKMPLSLKITWEEQTATSYLLDEVPNALFAVGLWKLRSAYTGSCLQVQRASDNATQDIGFDGQDLDVAALESFCAGTDGRLRILYDQSGKGHDWSSGTSALQPLIVSSGAAILENTIAAAQFASDGLTNTDTIQGTASDYTVSAVHNRSDTSGYLFDTSTGRLIFDNPGTGYWGTTVWHGAGYTHGAQTHIVMRILGAGGEARKDGASIATGVSYNQRAIQTQNAIGCVNTGSGASGIVGTLQHLVVWAGDKNADVADIESIVNGYFNIY